MKPILSVNDLAHRLGVSVARLRELCQSTDQRYRSFPLAKKRRPDKVRQIRDPNNVLKDVQRRIAKYIFAPMGVATQVHGGVKKRSPRTNAQAHLGKAQVLTIDVREFFPSIRPAIILRYFRREIGYGREVSSILTRLVTLEGGVPQGAPTSMAIANLILSRFDGEIVKLAQDLKIGYTRYVDDLAFSGEDATSLISAVGKLLSNYGLRIHRAKKSGRASKLQIMRASRPQQVTGLNVNCADKPSVPRSKRDQLRAAIHMRARDPQNADSIETLRGRIVNVRQYNVGAADRLSRQLQRIVDSTDPLQNVKLGLRLSGSNG